MPRTKVEETLPFIHNQHKKDIQNYKTYNIPSTVDYKTYVPSTVDYKTDIPSTVDSLSDVPQSKRSLNQKISICLGVFIGFCFLAPALVLFFYDYNGYDDVTRIPKRYQLCRNNYDIFDYTIESSFLFASTSSELTMVQDVTNVNSLTQNFTLNLNASSPNVTSSLTSAIIKQIDGRLGGYQIQEFFYQNDSVVYYDSPVTSVSYIANFWPIIVEISFKASKKGLEPSALEACNFRIIFDKKGFFNDFDGYIERKCGRAKEYHFYLVSQVEGNTTSGLKFFQREKIFATVSGKSLNREMRNVAVEGGAPFPSLIPTLYAIYYDYFKMKRQVNDITRIPNSYQLLRNDWDIYSYSYSIQSTSFVSYNASNNTIQDFTYLNRAMIQPIEYPSGKYYVQEFFYKSDTVDYSLTTTNSNIQYKWPAIVEIYFTSSGNFLDPYSLEVCNFRFAFFKEGYDKDIEGLVERKCPRAFESSFYIVSRVEGNSNIGFKFLLDGSEFATVSSKSQPREKSDVIVKDEAPFPSLIPTLYAIYYDYFKMKRQARDITRIPNNYQLLRDKLNLNNYEIQSMSFISPYNEIVNTSSTIRAIIKAIKYPSGQFSIREFFYETSIKNYSHTLITANSTIQNKWPAIVEIYFTSLGNSLDPYSLEVCNFRLAFFKEGYDEDIKGHVERKCPRAFESNFYQVSKVEGNSDVGFKFFNDGNEFATVSSKVQYREKRQVFNVVVNDNSPFTSLIPGLYTIYYDYLKRKSHAQDLTRIPKIYQLRWNSWYWGDYNYVIESKFYSFFAISDIYESKMSNNDNISFKQNCISSSNDDENNKFSFRQNYTSPLNLTAKVTLQSLLPGIVDVSFITSDKVIDPYALEACEYKLIYFENLEGQIKRRCKRAFEDDFYMVSKVSGSTYWGLNFSPGEDESSLSAWISAVYYWPSRRRRDVMVFDDAPFPSIIPALYSVYYDYVAKNR
ncbi:844_t:CDS:2 [Cetraspora pellucida]|uniref:844_t:CDS:1 n=1 Tax=Cetraspora pellucida TaxID=1433469 RepID=A0ACA9LF47_9GLOM|nr:844_t:CDS:2 [Cetraspora pellucida]